MTGVSQEEIEGLIELLKARDNLNYNYAGTSKQWNKSCYQIKKIITREFDRITGKNSEWSIKIVRTRKGYYYKFFSDHTKPYTIKMMKGYVWKNGWVKQEAKK